MLTARKAVVIIFLFSITNATLAQVNSKKVIEFGWNYPDVSQLLTDLPKMQELPFDGIVFSVQRNIINTFDTVLLTDDYFIYTSLPKLAWTKFTDNFIYLWGMSTSGAHWLSDSKWSVIIENIRRISKAAQLSGAKGVLFDPEYYYADPNLDPWKYRPEFYSGLSYKQVSDIVRKRGEQFIKALESNKKDIKILFTSIFGPISEELKHKPLEENGQALLVPFVEGMLSGQGKNSVIIDGNENAYWYKTAAEFFESGNKLRNTAKRLLPKTIKLTNYEVAQCLYYDGIFDLIPNKKNSSLQEQEDWFNNNLYNALGSTDEYVWLYSEKFNWWKTGRDSNAVKLLEEGKRKYNSSRK